MSASWAQAVLPQFTDYPAGEIFTGTSAAPRIITPVEKAYAHEIRDGVEEGYGVLRDGKEQKGPNFGGHLIVIQWGCGAPCLRMALVGARTGEVYYPPISANGVGARSFDLPLLTIGNSVSRASYGGSPAVCAFRLTTHDENNCVARYCG